MQAESDAKVLAEHTRSSSEDVFPPETSRPAEIESFLAMFHSVFPSRTALYVSAPITSGRRFVEWYVRLSDVDASTKQYQRDHLENVVTPNRNAAVALVTTARARSRSVIDPTAVNHIEGWTQGDYRNAWARVIEEFVQAVVFADGWEFSNGC